MNTPRIIPSSQTPDVVTWTIKVNDQEIPGSIRVGSIRVTREVNKIPSATVRIEDGNPSKEDFEISNSELFVPGNPIEFHLGYRSDNSLIFKGIIISHKNTISTEGSELIVECRDEAVVMTIGRKMRHFKEMSDAEIAEEILTQSKLERDVESTETVYEDVIQYDVTDWDFIVSRMDRIGKICVVVDGNVSFFTPKPENDPVLDVLHGATIIDYHAEIDSRAHFPGIQLDSWDYSNQEIRGVEADTPESWENDAGNLTSKELSAVTDKKNDRYASSGKFSEEEQQAIIDARLQKQRLSKIRGNVTFMGFPEIYPGDFIGLNGVGERFEGPVFVNGVTQNFEDGNWTTEVEFGLSPEWFAEKINPYAGSSVLGRLSSVSGLMIGIAEDLEDPLGEERVRVKIPAISDADPVCWARIATPDAGNNRGIFFRPEIGDEVIVGFIENDPGQAVILGMLNSSAKPAPFTASDENHEKGYVSRENMKFTFNDDEKSVKIETPAGKSILISEKENLIQLMDENSNKVTLDSSGITLQSSVNLNIQAENSLKVKATTISLEGTSVSISGDGITEIQGGIVKIN